VRDHGSECGRLRRQLAELQEDLPGKGLQQLTPEENAALEAAAPEQYRLLHDLQAHHCS
jgi:hypothetical protein